LCTVRYAGFALYRYYLVSGLGPVLLLLRNPGLFIETYANIVLSDVSKERSAVDQAVDTQHARQVRAALAPSTEELLSPGI
jgi:hypothetical protein